MKDLLVLLAHLLTTIAKLLGPGGAKAVVADSLLMKQQLLVISRSRRRAPNLSALDRVLLGFWSLFLSPRRCNYSAMSSQLQKQKTAPKGGFLGRVECWIRIHQFRISLRTTLPPDTH